MEASAEETRPRKKPKKVKTVRGARGYNAASRGVGETAISLLLYAHIENVIRENPGIAIENIRTRLPTDILSKVAIHIENGRDFDKTILLAFYAALTGVEKPIPSRLFIKPITEGLIALRGNRVVWNGFPPGSKAIHKTRATLLFRADTFYPETNYRLIPKHEKFSKKKLRRSLEDFFGGISEELKKIITQIKSHNIKSPKLTTAPRNVEAEPPTKRIAIANLLTATEPEAFDLQSHFVKKTIVLSSNKTNFLAALILDHVIKTAHNRDEAYAAISTEIPKHKIIGISFCESDAKEIWRKFATAFQLNTTFNVAPIIRRLKENNIIVESPEGKNYTVTENINLSKTYAGGTWLYFSENEDSIRIINGKCRDQYIRRIISFTHIPPETLEGLRTQGLHRELRPRKPPEMPTAQKRERPDL